MEKACKVTKFDDLRNLALTKACWVAPAYFDMSESLVSLNIASHSSVVNETTASKYMENINASVDFGTCSRFSLASIIMICTVGEWNILIRGLALVRNICHNLKIVTGEGCRVFRFWVIVMWLTRNVPGSGKRFDSDNSSSDDASGKTSFWFSISSQTLSHRGLSLSAFWADSYERNSLLEVSWIATFSEHCSFIAFGSWFLRIFGTRIHSPRRAMVIIVLDFDAICFQ